MDTKITFLIKNTVFIRIHFQVLKKLKKSMGKITRIYSQYKGEKNRTDTV